MKTKLWLVTLSLWSSLLVNSLLWSSMPSARAAPSDVPQPVGNRAGNREENREENPDDTLIFLMSKSSLVVEGELLTERKGDKLTERTRN